MLICRLGNGCPNLLLRYAVTARVAKDTKMSLLLFQGLSLQLWNFEGLADHRAAVDEKHQR